MKSTGILKEYKHLLGLDILFDLSPDLLCLLNQNGCFLKTNKYLRQALGYSENEMHNRNFLDFIHPEDRENSIKQLEALARNEVVSQFKNRYRSASGLYKSFSWNAVQLPDKTFYASARDITQSLNIQNQLAKAITENQKLYDNSLDVFCVFDVEGRFIRVSKAAKTILGYNEQELLGKNFLDFVHPDDLASTIAIGRDIKSGNKKTNFENRYIHKNGSVVPLIWSAQWLPLENNAFATARDATEREKQKEKLYFNERRLAALLESGNDRIGILNADGIYQYISPSVKKFFNLGPDNFIGKTPFDFIHPDDVERIKSALAYILTTEEPVHVSPFRIQNGDGHWCWIETYATNMLNDPAIQGIVVNSRDISIKIKDEEEKRFAAENLRLSNERYQLVTEVTKDVIWDWNLETNQLSREKGFEKHFGYPTELKTTFGNSTWEAYIHPDDKERILKSIHNTINNPDEKFWREEYRFLKADGSVGFITDQGYIIRNAYKKAIRMVGAMHDITELKEKELCILKQNKQLREIAQINSHVIRRPVASILGLIDIFDKKAVTGKDNLEILEHLESCTQELDMVIRSINDITLD
ncbi:PAS domain-containing protein [Mucilaginibacter arboris]|uniref:histidine kinase n=1 Tax=Mucilaginibacter arboris TaxID=2682090 RepID=A0A7K1SVR8_9SPHI|nr:PAS domain-containing protein [Mucilaginibacter arboris]MVN21415.1 PAS domain S-box protein [Mucilaginibacter arboris]